MQDSVPSTPNTISHRLQTKAHRPSAKNCQYGSLGPHSPPLCQFDPEPCSDIEHIVHKGLLNLGDRNRAVESWSHSDESPLETLRFVMLAVARAACDFQCSCSATLARMLHRKCAAAGVHLFAPEVMQPSIDAACLMRLGNPQGCSPQR
eukprot:3823360-Amphidinium_carterae.2